MILVNGNIKIEWIEGLTVKKLIDQMDVESVIISVNDEIIPTESYNTFIIPDNAEIKLNHLFHGG